MAGRDVGVDSTPFEPNSNDTTNDHTTDDFISNLGSRLSKITDLKIEKDENCKLVSLSPADSNSAKSKSPENSVIDLLGKDLVENNDQLSNINTVQNCSKQEESVTLETEQNDPSTLNSGENSNTSKTNLECNGADKLTVSSDNI